MEKTEQKPLIVEIDESKQEIVNSINNALQKIPCYFVDMILTEISTQIKLMADKELAMAKTQAKDDGAE